MPPRRFPVHSLLREVRENARASPVRSSLVAAFAVAVGAMTALATIVDVGHINQAWERQVYAWRFVDVVHVADHRGMPAHLCDSLQSISGVIASGGLTASRRIHTPHSPTRAIELHQATSGYLKVAWPTLPMHRAPRVIAGTEVGEEIGLVDDTTIRFAAAQGRAPLRTSEPLIIDWIAPQRSRIDGINRAVIIAVAPTTARTKECLVEYEPGAAVNASKVVQGWFPVELKAAVSDMLPPNKLIADPEHQLSSRASGFNWAIAGGFLSILLAALWWAARAETGLYRLLGMTRAKRSFMYAAEVLVFVAVPFQMGFCVGIVAMGVAPPPVWAALARDNLAALAVFALCPLLGIVITSRTSAIDTLKDH